MAWIVGHTTEAERTELRRRGWGLKTPPKCYQADLGVEDGIESVEVYVDTNLFEIMSGPDWDKGEGA